MNVGLAAEAARFLTDADVQLKRGVQNLVEPTWLSKVFDVTATCPLTQVRSTRPLSYAPMTRGFF
jgi:hypothetical protein